MMEAASTSETSVNFYQTTRRNKPEYSYLHTRRCENMKSHLEITYVNAVSIVFISDCQHLSVSQLKFQAKYDAAFTSYRFKLLYRVWNFLNIMMQIILTANK
jgi:hypothetical protein